MHKLINEFKEFAIKGNAVDLAIGIIIGTSFGAITNSLVNDIIMPPLGFLLGKIDFSELTIQLNTNVSINYGSFINTLINFIIIAFVMFIVVKQMNTLRSKNKTEVTEKTCPLCKKVIHKDAVRCPFCTGDLNHLH